MTLGKKGEVETAEGLTDGQDLSRILIALDSEIQNVKLLNRGRMASLVRRIRLRVRN